MDLLTEADTPQWFAPQSALLAGFALTVEASLLQTVHAVIVQAPLRQMVTPGGHPMSVRITNCGDLGWVSDKNGYRYTRQDPVTQSAWPVMPSVFLTLANRAAACAGFADFIPDACLINQYAIGARMGLHRDQDEADLRHPIVSVSLGLPAVFQFGGSTRQDRVCRLPLHHGDVLVWGGVSRMNFHGILPVKAGHQALLGATRVNLTFRKAG